MVETTLVSVFLLLLVGGMVDLGGAFQNYIIVTNAAREGARAAARLPCKADNRVALRAAIVQASLDEAAGSNVVLAATDIVIAPDPVSEGCAAAGEPIEVTVMVSYQTLLGSLWGGGAAITVRNSATMAYAGAD